MARYWLALRLLAVVFGLAWPAQAWLTVQVTSNTTRVEVASGGRATVTHDLFLVVRGGPLREFSLAGVDTDAAWVGTPTLTKAKSGELAGLPIHLTPVLTGDIAHFALQYAKGVGRGEYILHMAYLTDLRHGDRVRSAGDEVELSWQSPRFDDGVDGLRVSFAFPTAQPAPRVAGGPRGTPGKTELIETSAGIVISELQREAAHDVLVLTKPHVARKERVAWRVSIADSALDLRGALPAAPLEVGTERLLPEPPPSAVEVPNEGLSAAPRLWLISWGGALVYALLVWLKFRDGSQRALVSWGLTRRLAASFALMGCSLTLSLVWEFPTIAVGLLLLGFLLAISAVASEPEPVRGPGVWRVVDPAAIEFEAVPQRRSRWFDIGSVPGLLGFLAVLFLAMIVGLRLLGVAPYYSAMTLVYSAALAPLFCTFGGSPPQGAVVEQYNLLRRFAQLLKRRGVAVEWLGRTSEGRAAPDELRLSITSKRSIPGLSGIEVGVEVSHTLLKRVTALSVLVRVLEGTPAEMALPRTASICRGRHSDERVFLLRPAIPLAALTLEIVVDCLKRLEGVALPKPRGKATRRAAPSAAGSGRAVTAG
jgi:hypothetical protein